MADAWRLGGCATYEWVGRPVQECQTPLARCLLRGLFGATLPSRPMLAHLLMLAKPPRSRQWNPPGPPGHGYETRADPNFAGDDEAVAQEECDRLQGEEAAVVLGVVSVATSDLTTVMSVQSSRPRSRIDFGDVVIDQRWDGSELALRFLEGEVTTIRVAHGARGLDLSIVG